MIDTDKYEGHTEGPWEVNNPDDDESLIFSVGALKFVSSANTRLITDAPLFLAEVKRLRSGMQDILDDFETTKTDMWSIIKRIQELVE